MINPELVELYKKGDRIGQHFESNGLFQHKDIQWEDPKVQLALNNSLGSDESDLVNNFIKFTSQHVWVDIDTFLWGWCLFLSNHHGTGYGRTYTRFFADMKSFKKTGRNMLDVVRRVARDNPSLGNGCLALVYPAYCYAIAKGLPTRKFVYDLTTLAYCHPKALWATGSLHDLIDNRYRGQRIAPVFEEPTSNIPADDCLDAAVYCADGETEQEVILKAIRLGGDVDSMLSLALLIWGITRGGMNVTITR